MIIDMISKSVDIFCFIVYGLLFDFYFILSAMTNIHLKIILELYNDKVKINDDLFQSNCDFP